MRDWWIGNAGLIVDYGYEGSNDSIRGFHKHQQVPFVCQPGMVDVTADVYFAALRHAVNTLPDLKEQTQAFGPVGQGDFLMSMGAQERVIQYIESSNTTDEEAENLYQALLRLASPEEMGQRYKVLAIARPMDGSPPPAFERKIA